MDVQDILDCSPEGRDLPAPVKVPVDFYPLSVLMTKGIVSGVEVDIVERKDIGFSYFRLGSRVCTSLLIIAYSRYTNSLKTHLFFQHLLRHHLTNRNEAAALGLARLFESVSYFEHALEVLLHVVLDDEADSQPDPEGMFVPPPFSLSHHTGYKLTGSCKIQSLYCHSLFASCPISQTTSTSSSNAHEKLKSHLGHISFPSSVLHKFFLRNLWLVVFSKPLEVIY